MNALKKVTVSEIVGQLRRPFALVPVASVGELVASVYVAQGDVDWHRHLDSDELFWVHSGTLEVESEAGSVTLEPNEVTVVPRGVAHRSDSEIRTGVLLLQAGVGAGRRNGRRRLYAIGDEARLERIDLRAAAQACRKSFRWRTLAWVEDSLVQVARGEGTWPVEIPVAGDRLLFVLGGTATVRTRVSMVHLHPGDLTVVPRGAVHQLSTTGGTALVRVVGEE